MLSYEFYKVLHLFSLFLLLSTMGISFYSKESFKHIKILSGVATLFVLISGMGLLARLGVQHGSAWPHWVYVKLVVWLLIGVGGAIVAKRLPQHSKKAYFVMLILALIAAVAANLKF